MARIYLACDRAAFFASLPAGTGPDAPRGVDSRGDFRVDSRGGEGVVDLPLWESSSIAILFGETMVLYFRERVDQETEEVNVIAMLNSLDLLIHLLGRPFLLLAMPTLSSLVLVILDYNVATVPRFHGRFRAWSATSTMKRCDRSPIARPASSPPSRSSKPSFSTAPTIPPFPRFPLLGGSELDLRFSLHRRFHGEFYWKFYWKFHRKFHRKFQWGSGFPGFSGFPVSGDGAAAASD